MTNPHIYGDTPRVSNYKSFLAGSNTKNSSFEIYKIDAHSLLQSDTLRLTSFEFVWFLRGKGSVVVDGYKRSIDDDCILFLTPGLLRRLDIQHGSECHIIDFSLEFLNIPENPNEYFFLQDYYGDSVTLPTAGIEPDLIEEMADLKTKMMREFEIYGLRRPDILRAQLKLFLTYISRNLRSGEKGVVPNKDKGLVKQYLSLVKKEYKTKKMVAEYAGELFITPSYLNDVVKRVSGFPASYHIKQCIVNEAKNHALFSNLTMKEIANYLGFNDYAHFSKFFKNATGSNFTTFKREMEH